MSKLFDIKWEHEHMIMTSATKQLPVQTFLTIAYCSNFGDACRCEEVFHVESGSIDLLAPQIVHRTVHGRSSAEWKLVDNVGNTCP